MINLFQMPTVKVEIGPDTHLLHGKVVEVFEDEFAKYVGSNYACGVSSCTMAIYLTLTYLKHMDLKVNLPTMIPPVVANAVIHSGVKWQFIDNPGWMGNAYTLAENPILGRIVDSAQYVSKDCAKFNGAFATLFSFYPTKPIAGIDGGMIATDNVEFYRWLRKAVMNGTSGAAANSWDRPVEFPGWKAYLSTAQAMVARSLLYTWPERRARIGEIETLYSKVFHRINRGYHLYIIDVDENIGFCERMSVRGVGCGIHYYCLHKMACYAGYGAGKLSNSENACGRVVSLPFHAGLSDENVDYIIKAVRECR